MSVKLIAEKILTADDFSSATEQEGEHIGQPVPDSSNTGAFRLLSADGDIVDFSYSGTTTSDGAGDGTTVIDSVLSAFGDDYFIGGTVEITSGACNGEIETISDFAQSTGTITTSAFTAQIVTGVTFTLTVAYATRDFRVELVAAGDAGDATFKWSHDGGTTYFGRDNPTQADWLAATSIYDSITGTNATLLQAANDDIFAFFRDSADSNYIAYASSSDSGIIWTSPTRLSANTYLPTKALKLKNNRLILFTITSTRLFYSDDDGNSWSSEVTLPASTITDAAELSNGNIIAVYATGGNIECIVSNDRGVTWSSGTTITSAANTQNDPSVTIMENGDILCAYTTDEDSVGNDEIKGKISSDGGTTWGSTINIMNYSTNDLDFCKLMTDINGTIFCCARKVIAGPIDDIIFTYSTDNGTSWAAQQDLKSTGTTQLIPRALTQIDGHEIWCTYIDNTNNDLDYVKRGIWEAFSANACPCAIQAQEQKLICDIGIAWYGGGGETSNPDKWTFTPDYSYTMKNLIEDSPSKPWRSEQDNIACNIVIDIGTNEIFQAAGIGLFGCNIRTCSFQMNATDSWGSPSVDESISFDVDTGTVDAVSANRIQDTSLFSTYKNHALTGLYLRMTSGTDNGVTWEIRDNVGEYVFLETTASNNISASDTFAIFQSSIAKTFTGGGYRFMRLAISAQHTADDYYQIGSIVVGQAITLSDDFAVGYGKNHVYDIDMIRTPHGGLIPVKDADRKRVFNLQWQAVSDTQQELAAVIDYVEGKNIVLIPDHSDLTDCYLVKHIGDLQQMQRYLDYFDVQLTLEEIL